MSKDPAGEGRQQPLEHVPKPELPNQQHSHQKGGVTHTGVAHPYPRERHGAPGLDHNHCDSASGLHKVLEAAVRGKAATTVRTVLLPQRAFSSAPVPHPPQFLLMTIQAGPWDYTPNMETLPTQILPTESWVRYCPRS